MIRGTIFDNSPIYERCELRSSKQEEAGQGSSQGGNNKIRLKREFVESVNHHPKSGTTIRK